MQIVLSSVDPVCPVGYINFTKLKLAPKTSPIKYKIKTSRDFVQMNQIDNEMLDELQKDTVPVDDAKESNCALIMNRGSKNNFVYIQNKPQMVLNRKGWLFLTGIQCSDTEPSLAIVEGLSQIEKMLTSEHYSLENLLNVVLYVNDMRSFASINSAYVNKINFQNPPTRICVECELPKNCSIIMEAIAYKPKTISTDDFTKKTLHVQSLSHWAPANIGPYSQAIQVSVFYFNFKNIFTIQQYISNIFDYR